MKKTTKEMLEMKGLLIEEVTRKRLSYKRTQPSDRKPSPSTVDALRYVEERREMVRRGKELRELLEDKTVWTHDDGEPKEINCSC